MAMVLREVERRSKMIKSRIREMRRIEVGKK